MTKLAIVLRPLSIRVFYHSLIIAFILLILVMSNTVTSTFTLSVTLLLGMLILLP